MCFFLSMASPLTLSEVRSMLPSGLAAQPAGAVETAALRRIHASAQTVATLLVGGCSCDLVRARESQPREDERYLRTRYFQLNLPRDRIIRELERHRRRDDRARGAAAGPESLASFVAEHARNAGPTLYYLRFGPADAFAAPEPSPAMSRTVAEVRARPDGWLEEGRPVIIER